MPTMPDSMCRLSAPPADTLVLVSVEVSVEVPEVSALLPSVWVASGFAADSVPAAASVREFSAVLTLLLASEGFLPVAVAARVALTLLPATEMLVEVEAARARGRRDRTIAARILAGGVGVKRGLRL